MTYTKTLKRDAHGRAVTVYTRTGSRPQMPAGGGGSDLARLIAAVKALTAEVRRAKAQGRL